MLELLGRNLTEARREAGGIFDSKITMEFTIQMIQCVHFLHDTGFLHRDVKPTNFCIGRGDKCNKVYLIDFGMCRPFLTNSGKIKAPRTNLGFYGTFYYCSINAHLQQELSPRDDLLSLFYSTIELVGH